MNLFGLREYQQKAIDEIENNWRNGIRSQCLQAPTGSGKSVILRNIVDNHHASKKVIYAIVHRKNLVSQFSGHLENVGIKHGLIMAGNPYLRYRVQVCSMQTLIGRIDKLPEPEIIIIDEAHHSKSSSYQKIIKKWPFAKILGVTATPSRTDGKGLDDIFQKLIIGPSVRYLMDQKFLSDYDYFAPDTVSMEGVNSRMGDFIKSESEKKVDNKYVIGSAVDHYRKYSDHLPAIAACVSIEHSIHVAENFNESGYKFRAIHSKMHDSEIEKAVKGLSDGSLDGITNCDLIGEGTDIPVVTTLIGLRPTQSETIFLQHIGRVLRLHDDKEKAVILDHVGNWMRHGLPDDDREWSLKGKPRSKEAAKLKKCAACLRPITISARSCPHCGYLIKETLEAGSRIPEEKEGVLINVKDRKQKQDLVIKIAREANSLKHAVRIAKNMGLKHTEAFDVWTRVLKNNPDLVVRL